jgi:hypothetical protein
VVPTKADDPQTCGHSGSLGCKDGAQFVLSISFICSKVISKLRRRKSGEEFAREGWLIDSEYSKEFDDQHRAGF